MNVNFPNDPVRPPKSTGSRNKNKNKSILAKRNATLLDGPSVSIREARSCGGMHTVVQPEEKVFRNQKLLKKSAFFIPKQLMKNE